MDVLNALSAEALVYIAFGLYVTGFMARDELILRGLVLAGSAFYLAYYYSIADTPLWEALITTSILALVNLVMMVVILFERSTIGMSRETAEVYGHFPMLRPGQFRRVVRVADRVEADDDQTLIVAGEQPQYLYFMLHGPIDIEKQDENVPIDAGIFLGEIAFLSSDAASATVRVRPGGVFLRWEVEKLRRMLTRFPALNSAVVANFNVDLAKKLAISMPMASPKWQ